MNGKNLLYQPQLANKIGLKREKKKTKKGILREVPDSTLTACLFVIIQQNPGGHWFSCTTYCNVRSLFGKH